MKKIKNKAMIAVASVALLNIGRSFAMEVIDINNNSLEFYPGRYSSDTELKDYLKGDGVLDEEYEKYVNYSRRYRYSKEKKWESIENGTIMLDEILFSIDEIKIEYENKLKEVKNKEQAYEIIKKSLINNSQYVIYEISNILTDKNKMVSIFNDKYTRKPTAKEEEWLSDIKTLKYALYGGELGREITNSERSMIENGIGYRVLDLYKDQIEDYAEYVTLRNKLVKKEIDYYNSIGVFSNLREKLYEKYKIDIYTKTSKSERLEIHKESINVISFNEEKAYILLEKLLIEKGLIKVIDEDENENDTISPPGGSISQDSSSSNPKNELTQHLNSSQTIIRNSLLSSLKNLYKIQKVEYENNLRDTYIWFKYKGKNINTYIRPFKNGELSKEKLKTFLDSVNTNLESKMIFSKKEMLILLEKNIKTTKLAIGEKKLNIDDLIDPFERVGIKVYEKNIEIEEDKSDVNKESPGDRYKVIVNMGDSMCIIPSDREGRVYINEFTTLLELIGMKYVLTTDSVLILSENEICKIDTDIYIKGFVTDKEIKKVFEKMDKAASVKLINSERRQ